jgi:hypothetical protein
VGDFRVLKDQIEIGVPLESAAILAGYEFEEMEALSNDPQIKKMIATADANFISRHLTNIAVHSDVNPRMSTWLLERRFPERFSQANRNIEKDDIPKSVILRGVDPDADRS